MVSDREPRYRLVDASGNVVGSLHAESDGTLKLQEGTSGSDNEVSVATDGTFTAPSVSADQVNGIEYATPTGQSIPDAISGAGVGGTVVILAGAYSVSSLSPLEDQTIKTDGESVVLSSSGFGIDTSANGVEIDGLTVETDPTNGSTAVRLLGDDSRARGVTVTDSGSRGIEINGDSCHVHHCAVLSADGPEIIFGGSSSNCVAVGNITANAISDSGTNNSVPSDANVVIQ